MAEHTTAYIRWLSDVDRDDVAAVGGKNASLGEMIQRLEQEGIRVPGGFATTTAAYRSFVEANDLEAVIRERIGELYDGAELGRIGEAIRSAFAAGEMPDRVERAIREAYEQLAAQYGVAEVDVAARSSATAEDMPEASFAGQQETYLNVRGADAAVDAVMWCFASLFTDRLGEIVVSGETNPDAYVVYTPLLEDGDLRPILSKELGAKNAKIVYGGDGGRTRTVDTSPSERDALVLDDDEILTLARWCAAIGRHYGEPMDIEWAKDGETDALFIVQARPETVQSQKESAALSTYHLKEEAPVLVDGLAIGDAIASGRAIRLDRAEQGDRFRDDAVLVTGMTDPDWVPIMKRAAAIVTDHGGRTAHAAIVSRELGLPAVVGTGDATSTIADGQEVTVSCAQGDEGRVYEGLLNFDRRDVDLDGLPDPRTRIMMNIASPTAAFRWWRLPARGIGLARIEFIINNHVGVHPLALTRFDELDDDVRAQVAELTAGYHDRTEYLVERLARGVARIAASQHPDPVIARMSDFKTNEYADLLGGAQFEPDEANPMLGFRGASRYYSEHYRDGFALECRAMRMARQEIGLTNITLMIPFVRTVEEADRVLEVLADNGLERGKDELKIYMMAEIPSNVTLAEQFAERFDGFSIGSNDLTQLELGIDRDSALLTDLFDERNDAVTTRIAELIDKAHAHDTPVGICGEAPSNHPDFAAFLVRAGIDSISLNPDSVVGVVERVAEIEQEQQSW